MRSRLFYNARQAAAFSEEAFMDVYETTSTIFQIASTVEVITLTVEKLNSEINHFKL